MKPKKKTRKKRGHRQEITRFLINSINLNGEVLAYEAAPTGAEYPVIDADFAEETAEESSAES
jgi:large subunit ribosomal protein L21